MTNELATVSTSNALSSLGVDFTPTIHNDTYEYIRPQQFSLTGKAVLITGASKGIGRQTALSFAAAGASFIALGARSNLTDLEIELQTAAKAAGRSSPKVLSLQMDVGDYQAVQTCALAVENEFGRLDILINNAGTSEPFVSVLETDPAQWKQTWSVNVFGVFHVTKAFLPLLRKTEDGLKEILFTSSIGAHVTANMGGSAYRPSKLAVLRFAELVAAENPDVLAYSIHPGGILTEVANNLPANMHSQLIDSPQLAADTPVWLMAQRRDWLSGRYVSVTWDMEELLKKRAKIEAEDLLKVRMAVGFA